MINMSINSELYLPCNLAVRDMYFYSKFLSDFFSQKEKDIIISGSLIEKFFNFLCETAAEEKSNRKKFSAWLRNQAEVYYSQVIA